MAERYNDAYETNWDCNLLPEEFHTAAGCEDELEASK